MPSIIIGEPQKPQEDKENPAFYIHDNLYAYLDTRPDGVYVIGTDPKSAKPIFEKRCNDAGEAMGFIQAKRDYFDKLYGTKKEGQDGASESGGSGQSGTVHSGGDEQA